MLYKILSYTLFSRLADFFNPALDIIGVRAYWIIAIKTANTEAYISYLDSIVLYIDYQYKGDLPLCFLPSIYLNKDRIPVHDMGKHGNLGANSRPRGDTEKKLTNERVWTMNYF